MKPVAEYIRKHKGDTLAAAAAAAAALLQRQRMAEGARIADAFSRRRRSSLEFVTTPCDLQSHQTQVVRILLTRWRQTPSKPRRSLTSSSSGEDWLIDFQV